MKKETVQRSTMEVQDVWAAMKKGDMEALGILYDMYANMLFASGIRINGDREVVKDEIHNLFLDLFKYGNKLTDAKNIEGYLTISLKRRLYKFGGAKVKNLENEWELSLNPINNDGYVVHSHEERLVALENEVEAKNKLEKIMASLTEHQQKILRLRFKDEKTYEQIAEDLGLNVSSARTQVYRTLKTIRNTALTLFF
ncbi:MAG: sigma-70 family RNA polymerase sigma factor [Bacteroidota bacterium]